MTNLLHALLLIPFILLLWGSSFFSLSRWLMASKKNLWLPTLLLSCLGGLSAFFLPTGAQSWVVWLPYFFLLYVCICIGLEDAFSLRIDLRFLLLCAAIKSLWLLALWQLEPWLSQWGMGILATEFWQKEITFLAASGALYWLALSFEALRNKTGLGQADPALAGLLGLWVNWQGLVGTLLLASLLGLFGGLIWLRWRRLPIAKTQLPFAPFLCFAGVLIYWWQNTIL